eukprot:NODE_649_length_5558_cov_0.180253.p3 type:complete len:108 gc:universal NODE_649_length_5558_cov_0.180253:935-1258(+)
MFCCIANPVILLESLCRFINSLHFFTIPNMTRITSVSIDLTFLNGILWYKKCRYSKPDPKNFLMQLISNGMNRSLNLGHVKYLMVMHLVIKHQRIARTILSNLQFLL